MRTKKCKYCQEEIDKKAKLCPKCGRKLGLPGIVKFLIVVVIFIVGFVGCVSSCTNSVDKAVKEVKNSYADINGKTEFKLNESFENKYEKITMTEVNTNFKGYSKYSGPSEGNKVVMVKFEAENISEDELIVSSTEFEAYADGVIAERFYFADSKYKDFDAYASINKNKKAIGYIFYEVPKNAEKITIEYNANFWVDNTTIKFIVK